MKKQIDKPFKITDVLKEYRQQLTDAETENKELKKLINELFDLLEDTDTNDDGKVFSTTYFSSCRIQVGIAFDKLMPKLKKLIGRK